MLKKNYIFSDLFSVPDLGRVDALNPDTLVQCVVISPGIIPVAVQPASSVVQLSLRVKKLPGKSTLISGKVLTYSFHQRYHNHLKFAP